MRTTNFTALPFNGMEGPRDPQLVTVAINVHNFFPCAEWIRVKHLSNGRIIIAIRIDGTKTHARGYGHANATANLIGRVRKQPGLWKKATALSPHSPCTLPSQDQYCAECCATR